MSAFSGLGPGCGHDGSFSCVVLEYVCAASGLACRVCALHSAACALRVMTVACRSSFYFHFATLSHPIKSSSQLFCLAFTPQHYITSQHYNTIAVRDVCELVCMHVYTHTSASASHTHLGLAHSPHSLYAHLSHAYPIHPLEPCSFYTPT